MTIKILEQFAKCVILFLLHLLYKFCPLSLITKRGLYNVLKCVQAICVHNIALSKSPTRVVVNVCRQYLAGGDNIPDYDMPMGNIHSGNSYSSSTLNTHYNYQVESAGNGFGAKCFARYLSVRRFELFTL